MGPPLVGELKIKSPSLQNTGALPYHRISGNTADPPEIGKQLGTQKISGRRAIAAMMGETTNEVQYGWVSTPHPVAGRIINSVPLPPRFAIEEQRGAAAKKKIYPIGDFKRSGRNSLLKLHGDGAPNARRHVRDG